MHTFNFFGAGKDIMMQDPSTLTKICIVSGMIYSRITDLAHIKSSEESKFCFQIKYSIGVK